MIGERRYICHMVNLLDLSTQAALMDWLVRHQGVEHGIIPARGPWANSSSTCLSST